MPTSSLVRCLVVDDNRDVAVALGAFLEIIGAVVLVAFGGEDAIVVAQEFRPRLVVLDIAMPGLDGFETARRLKRQPWAPDAIFVAHTAVDSPRSAIDPGDFHYWFKKGDSAARFEALVTELNETGAK